MEIKIISADPNTSVYKDGILLSGSGTGGGIPVPTPTPVPPQYPPAPGMVLFPWPISGQAAIRSVGNPGQGSPNWYWYRLIVPNPLVLPRPLNTSHSGFISVAEAPGANTGTKNIIVKVNGVQKFSNAGWEDPAPRVFLFVNNPSMASITAVNAMMGDTMDIGIQSNGNWIADFASPNRY